MASRPRMALLVATIALASGCTTNTEVTNRTTPSDVFAPTPSIGDPAPATTTTESPPTTRPDVERAYVAMVDPRTLEELPGYLPIAMGDWMWGVTSGNGRWLALNIGDDDGVSAGHRLVDVDNWTVAGQWPDATDFGLAVTDAGAVYGQQHLTIGRLLVGVPDVEPVWTASADHSIWGPPAIDDDRYISYGTILDQEGGQGTFTVFTGNETGGALVATPLPGIRIGLADVVELADDRTGVIEEYPVMVWDAVRQRALIVHAGQDVVTEFDVASFEATDHVFGPEVQDPTDLASIASYPADVSFWVSSRRTAWLSPDGTRLYIAATSAEFEEVEGVSRGVNTPSGVLAVDTSTWTVVGRLEVPVSDIVLSPDGGRLMATGGREETTLSNYSLESSGWYLIDTANLSVIEHVDADRPDQWFGSISFNIEANAGYVSSWTTTNRVDVVDLDTGEIVASREGDNFQVFGDVAVIGDVADLVGH